MLNYQLLATDPKIWLQELATVSTTVLKTPRKDIRAANYKEKKLKCKKKKKEPFYQLHKHTVFLNCSWENSTP